jgi:hypothetical protein
MAASVWAKTIHVTGQVQCPNVDAPGHLASGQATLVQFPLSYDQTTRAFHGKAHAIVINNSGQNETFSNPAYDFGMIGITNSTYIVKKNGHATLTISGVLPP